MPDSSRQGHWTVTSFRSGDEVVVPADHTEATLSIDGDRISGTMGVNRFMGSNDGAMFGPLATTMMAGPDDLMAQEQELLEHLEAADFVEVVGDGMFVRHDGLLLMELERRGF